MNHQNLQLGVVEAYQYLKLGGDWVKPLNHQSFKFSDGQSPRITKICNWVIG
jgi:hypothetical protein